MQFRVGRQNGARKAFAQLYLVSQRYAISYIKSCSDCHLCPCHLTLDYHNVIYMRLILKTTQKLQLIQNVAMQAVMGMPFANILLCDLHWLPVYYQVQFKLLVATCKALYGVWSSYLRDCLFPTVSVWLIQSGRLVLFGCHLWVSENVSSL